MLVEWRKEEAGAKGVPAYQILGNKTLVAIAAMLPEDDTDLLSVPGIGKMKRAEYGERILSMVREYME